MHTVAYYHIIVIKFVKQSIFNCFNMHD